MLSRQLELDGVVLVQYSSLALVRTNPAFRPKSAGAAAWRVNKDVAMSALNFQPIVFGYNFPHKKTQDFLQRLVLLGAKPALVLLADPVKLQLPPAAMRDVATGGQYSRGPNVRAFEEEVADYCGCAFAVGVGSSTKWQRRC
jgi:hypothetical protein